MDLFNGLILGLLTVGAQRRPLLSSSSLIFDTKIIVEYLILLLLTVTI